MTKCTICGKQEYMMYRCNYCLQYFCSKHRLPENHLCPRLPKRAWKKVRNRNHMKPNRPRKKTKKRQTQKPIPKHIQRPQKTRVWLIVSLIIIGLTGMLYIENPEGFLTSVSEIANNGTELFSNISESIFIPENVYGNYSFGLVKGPDGVLSNSYGDFIVLINNENSKDPTYNQLVTFLKRDKTDEYSYQYTISSMGSYYGTAESHVNLTFVKGIVDGVEDMIKPRVCGDFAQRLHNSAELKGVRCGYVSIDLEGYTDPYNYGISSNTGHALNVFNTTDKGLIYIDCTGGVGGPPNHDTIIKTFQKGKKYIPESLFPQLGWETKWGNMGKITSIYITWDGDWN